MSTPNERILLVESDPDISDRIGRSTLKPLGYKVKVVNSASSAIEEVAQFAPDVVIADLDLPGLSGKDLIVALSSQGIDVPVIVIAGEGRETDVIQAFRLGAADFLSWPAREAEVLTAVERVMNHVRNQRERERLTRQLNRANQELHSRVRELTTIFSVGKAVVSTTDSQAVFNKIIEGAQYLTEANSAWLLVRDEESKSFILRAARNVPAPVSTKIDQAWDDGLSSLSVLSGESLSITGEPLKRFKISQLGQSALVVPVKANHDVIGLLVVMRTEPKPFNNSQQSLLESMADYASISLINARLFKALQDKSQVFRSEAPANDSVTSSNDLWNEDEIEKLSKYASMAKDHLDNLLYVHTDELLPSQREILELVQDINQKLLDLIEKKVESR
jgi:two-component system, NtrC family, sensor kinase